MFNTPPQACLALWLDALAAQSGALRVFTLAVAPSAARRPAALAALNEASAAAVAAIAAVPAAAAACAPGLAGEALAAAAFGVYAALAAAGAALARGSAAARDPGLLHDAALGMSRSFAAELGRKAAALAESAAAADRVAAAAGLRLARAWGPEVSAGPAALVAAAYAAHSPTTEAGAALFAAALRDWGRAGLPVAGLAAAAIDRALGGPPALSAAAAAAARARLHPVQAMGLTFGLHDAGDAGDDAASAALVLDATLPQAALAVSYCPEPLYDAEAAAAFGPAVWYMSGLNSGLVQRLQSFREQPVAPGAPTPGIRPRGGAGPAVRTVDGGATFTRLAPGLGRAALLSAGPKPRVQRLGELLAAAVFAPPLGGSPVLLDGLDAFLQRFADHEAGAPEVPMRALRTTVDRLFAAEYDRHVPASASEFVAAALGERAAPGGGGSYIAAAVAAVAGRATADRLARLDGLARAGPAALFGSRGAAGAQGKREMVLSGFLRAGEATGGAEKRLALAFQGVQLEAQARRLWAEGLGAGALRKAALELFARASADAFGGGASSEMFEVEPGPSLKVYALEHGCVAAQ